MLASLAEDSNISYALFSPIWSSYSSILWPWVQISLPSLADSSTGLWLTCPAS